MLDYAGHDFSQYRAMLKELRRSEESFEDGSKMPTYSRLVNMQIQKLAARCFGLRETETTKLICIFKSFAVKTNHFLPLGRFLFFWYNCKPHLLGWIVNVELEAYVVGLEHNFTPVRVCWVRRPVTSNDQWSEFSLRKWSLPFLRHSGPEFYPGVGVSAVYGLCRYVPLWKVWFSSSLLWDGVYKSESLGLE